MALSSDELPIISKKILELFYVMLGHPILSSLVYLFISKLTLRIQINNLYLIGFRVSKVLSHVVQVYPICKPMNAKDNYTYGRVGVSRPKGSSQVYPS